MSDYRRTTSPSFTGTCPGWLHDDDVVVDLECANLGYPGFRRERVRACEVGFPSRTCSLETSHRFFLPSIHRTFLRSCHPRRSILTTTPKTVINLQILTLDFTESSTLTHPQSWLTKRTTMISSLICMVTESRQKIFTDGLQLRW